MPWSIQPVCSSVLAIRMLCQWCDKIDVHRPVKWAATMGNSLDVVDHGIGLWCDKMTFCCWIFCCGWTIVGEMSRINSLEIQIFNLSIEDVTASSHVWIKFSSLLFMGVITIDRLRFDWNFVEKLYNCFWNTHKLRTTYFYFFCVSCSCSCRISHLATFSCQIETNYSLYFPFRVLHLYSNTIFYRTHRILFQNDHSRITEEARSQQINERTNV